MLWLLLASTIWGFSFGILKNLTISLDPFLVTTFRVGIAALFFLPWFLKGFIVFYQNQTRPSQSTPLPNSLLMKNIQAFICGAIQIGLMYGPYSLAFRYIKAHEVALFTMTTPLIMSVLITILTLFKEPHTNRKTLVRLVAAACLATIGGFIAVNNDHSSPEIAVGACLVQLSNIFFAAGLMLWTRWFDRNTETLQNLMTPFFLGALTSSMVLCAFSTESSILPTPEQWLALAWLGAVSSGLGFFLWNKGALKVNETTLSVANNIKLPIAIVISIAVFGEQARALPLTVGVILITLALKLGTYQPKTTQPH